MEPTAYQQKVDRISDLQFEMINSPQWQLRQRLITLDISRETFRRNYRDFSIAMMAHLPKTHDEAMRVFLDHRRRDEQQLEILCRLHNFVAGAVGLIEHSRNFHKELYASGNLIPDYQATIDRDFKSDGLSRFVQDLRNSNLHQEVPIIGTHYSGNAHQAHRYFTIYLDQAQLLRDGNLSAVAKRFVENGPKKIDLPSVIDQYSAKVLAFQAWFKSEQERVHKADLDCIEAIQAELRSLGADGISELQPLDSGCGHFFADEQIELLAYYIAADEGWPVGCEKTHWYRAIARLRELQAKRGARIV